MDRSTACDFLLLIHRARYIPCLDEECQVLLDQLEETGDIEVVDHLIESLDAARCRRWEETTEQMNFTQSTRTSWSLIRRLGAAQKPTKNKPSSGSENTGEQEVQMQSPGRMAVFSPTRSGQKLTSSLYCGRNLPDAAEYESWHRSMFTRSY